MNTIKAKITGPVEGMKGFFHAKGKYGSQDCDLLLQQKGGNVVLTALKKPASYVEGKRVISYQGGIVAEAEAKAGTAVEFKDVHAMLRTEPKRAKDLQQAKQAEAFDNLGKATELIKAQAAKLEALSKENAQLKAEGETAKKGAK